jgi:Flp pilus assembly protein TadB
MPTIEITTQSEQDDKMTTADLYSTSQTTSASHDSMTSSGSTLGSTPGKLEEFQTTTSSSNTKTENTMPTNEAQGGTYDNEVKIWNLTESNMILILCILCAIILLLLIIVIILACFLCITRRKYNVERTANIFRSETSTVDGVSTVDAHRGMPNKYPASLDRVDEY